jgi:hypothetical protein
MKTTKPLTMKTRHYLSVGILGLGLAGLLFTGCAKKSSQPTNADNYVAAQDDANAANAVVDSKNIADGAAKGQANERTMASACETFSVRDTLNHQDSLIDIFFGNTDCSCSDYKTRRGHIIVFWPKSYHYFDSGATISMTFHNYYVNDIGVTGLRTLTNIGKNNAGNQSWSFTANLTLTFPNNGGTATWTSTRTNVLTQTNGVWYYYVSGSASGTTHDGHTFSITITSPIVVTALPWWFFGCGYFESGSLTITVTGLPNIFVTFGTGVGNCNNDMTVTVNSHTYSNLKQW